MRKTFNILFAAAILLALPALVSAQAPGEEAAEESAISVGGGLVGVGAGIIVVGAGLGIGRFTAAAVESIARQPQAAKDIQSAFQLPLFLLEGVAVIGLGVLFVALLF